MSPEVNFGEITAFRLVTAAPEKLAGFYRAIGFEVAETRPILADEMVVLGLQGTGSRRAMSFGANQVDLDAFDQAGHGYPKNATACDLFFQHLALVTDDAETACRRALEAGATPISRLGPVTLPKSAGGVTAFKFRDPDGRPLEFLQFPLGPNADGPGSARVGIDHSAICVADIAVSRRFYAQRGLVEGKTSFNHGPTQMALDGLDDARVDVVPMNPVKTPPHVELLGYRRSAAAAPLRFGANDIAATRIVWRSNRDELVRDPDGHLHQLTRLNR